MDVRFKEAKKLFPSVTEQVMQVEVENIILLMRSARRVVVFTRAVTPYRI